MTIYKLPEKCPVDSLPDGCAIALGNFDGVHRGHQKLFELARKTGHPTAAWTFTSLAKPQMAVPYLTDMTSKLQLLADYGLDYAIFEDFEAVRYMECAFFAEEYLAAGLRPASVVCGFNFRFGHKGVGTAELLSLLLKGVGIKCHILNPVFKNNKTISSSSVRAAILSGDMTEAKELMGHPFAVQFPVVSGKKLGRQMGMPTINQNFPAGHIIPKSGVYACTVSLDGKKYAAVSNVGTRPTVSDDGESVNCETHILDYAGDLYGERIPVEFHSFLRDEQKFDSIDALTHQIKLDIEATRDFFANFRP